MLKTTITICHDLATIYRNYSQELVADIKENWSSTYRHRAHVAAVKVGLLWGWIIAMQLIIKYCMR